MADSKITQLTENTTPAVTDIIPMVDDPGGTPTTQKMTLSDLMKVIDGLTADAAPDVTADFIPTYDTSASSAKKVLIANILNNRPMEARLTLETGVPVSVTPQTAKTTLYLTPFKGNQVSVYTGSYWKTLTLSADISITLAGLTASRPYDVFVYDSSGTLTLELASWTNSTTRATNLVSQDGILVKSGATTRRYIGTICITSTTGVCEDSYSRRLVYNYYNQVPRQLARIYIASHNYTTAAWRYWNNSKENSQVEIVLGVAQNCMGVYRSKINSLAGGGVSFSVDSGTAPSGSAKGEQLTSAGDSASSDEFVFDIGYHYWVAIEYGHAGGMNADRVSMTMTAMM